MSDYSLEGGARVVSTSTQRALARANRRAVGDLFDRLRGAAGASFKSNDEVAAVLGVTPEIAADALAGRLDLSLSDLQDVALAVDAQVSFIVNERYSASRFAKHTGEEADRVWKTPPRPSADELYAQAAHSA